ncbi:MAG: WYL domain-containing protein, partial [Flavobacteriales bacterium]|nr:WYL domain-containing protein [Flavobacteriales bacterium]
MITPNRLALLRYHILDACFVWGDPTQSDVSVHEQPKKVFKPELLERVNALLKEASPGIKPIAMRTLEKDIADMQILYGVQIVKHSDHKRAYYGYSQRGMSIGSGALTAKEQALLQGVLSNLSRFRGAEGFEWWTEMEALLRHRFDLVAPQKKATRKRVLSQNIQRRIRPRVQEKSALRWLEGAVSALQLNMPVRVGFTASDAERSERHSMLIENLVEQSVGWLVLALVWDDEAQEAFRLVLPLDSIASWDDVLVDVPEGLKDAIPFPWSRYIDQRFALVPGVVNDADEKPMAMRLWFENKTAARYLTQPFHTSQDPRIERSGNGIAIHVNLVPNAPFIQWILHHGSAAQILEPAAMREAMGT